MSSPKIQTELNKALHNTIGSDYKYESREQSLDQAEIEAFEKANIEDMGIPLGLLPNHKFSLQDMDGIILDPIVFHSSENSAESVTTSDQYEDQLLYNEKRKMDFDDGYELSLMSSSSSLFNLNLSANTFLEGSFEDNQPSVNSFLSSNRGINSLDSSILKPKSLEELLIEHSQSQDKAVIEFDASEDIPEQIENWFVSNELSHLNTYKEAFLSLVNGKNIETLSETNQASIVATLVKKLEEYYALQEKFEYTSTLLLQNLVLLSNSNEHIIGKLTQILEELNTIQKITYLFFGNYAFSTKDEQLKTMEKYIALFIQAGLMDILLKNTKKLAQAMYLVDTRVVDSSTPELKRFLEQLKIVNEFWYLNLTCLYFILVFYPKLHDHQSRILSDLRSSKIMVFFVEYMEKWRYNNKVLMRIRNVIFLMEKLILTEFGNAQDASRTKEYLCKKYNVKWKRIEDEDVEPADLNGETFEQEKPQNPRKPHHKSPLHAFPLDYYVYTKDLTARYPSFTPPAPSYPRYLDNNSSLSQFIEVPRTLDSQFANNTLPVPTVHIATPAPSPASSPALGPNGKGKRSFQTNQAYPFIYPIEGESVPYAIKEASEIFAESVVESLSKKQLWNERVLFMQQERGWKSSINPTSSSFQGDQKGDADIYDIEDEKAEVENYPEYKSCVMALVKVEEYYKDILPTLGLLVNIFVNTIKSNTNGFEDGLFAEKKQDFEAMSQGATIQTDANAMRAFKQKLEIIKVKEVTLKSMLEVISGLMRWFKMSHVLKLENMGTIIYDSEFIDAFLAYLKRDNFSDKVFNEQVDIQEFGFFAKTKESGNHKEQGLALDKGYYFYDNLLLSDPKQTQEYLKQREVKKLEQKIDKNHVVTNPEIDLPNSKVYDTNGKIFNRRYLRILDNLFKVLQKIILNKTRRAVSLSEKQPVDTLRIVLRPFYNKAIYKSVLKVLKDIIPYNGKKWKSVNMDLILLIYINLDLKLKDHWLSGRDIESEVGDSEGQELALRALIQFYTARRYEEGIEKFGYERRGSDFFGRETDLIASNEMSERHD